MIYKLENHKKRRKKKKIVTEMKGKFEVAHVKTDTDQKKKKNTV